MKRGVWYVMLLELLTLLPIQEVDAQEKRMNRLLRIYEDNDFLNIRGKGTDKAYSGGTRFDLFYEKKRKSILLPGFLQGNPDSVVYMGQWGIMQTVFTPNNISDPYFQPDDYFYSGALFIIHSQFYYNQKQRYSFQTEFQAGIRGPSAFGQQAQTFFHRIIHYTIPRGWGNQLQNAPIINVNFGFEKQIASPVRGIELIGGGKSYLGTLQSGLSIYPLLRMGIMNPYFDGYISQVSGQQHAKSKNRIQVYIIVRPEMQFVLNNALLKGGDFARKPIFKLSGPESSSLFNYSNTGIRHCVYALNYGAVVSTGKFGLSFIQNTSSEMRKGTYSHEVGNISMYLIL